MYGHCRISRQIKPVRWFSIIKTIGPWFKPKFQGDTQPHGLPDLTGKVGLKLALKPYGHLF